MYSVKECFYSLQGEGAHSGRPAVFCRFAGCNLWNGLERDRSQAACNFCDTDFIGTDGQGGGKFSSATALAEHLASFWPANQPHRYLVFTGGEPLLQLDHELIEACHAAHFSVAIETNGTLPAPAGIDWICVSPKGAAQLVLTQGDELKLVYPQVDNRPQQFEQLDFGHFYLQPLAGVDQSRHQQACIQYCLEHPQWRLSLQTHKLLGID